MVATLDIQTTFEVSSRRAMLMQRRKRKPLKRSCCG